MNTEDRELLAELGMLIITEDLTEEDIDIEIPDSDAERVVTVGDVVDYIKENV